MESDSEQPFIDIFLNPNRETEKREKVTAQRSLSHQYFTNLSSVYPELFRLLWHTSLPCSPQPEVTTHSLVQSCQLAGQTVDCGKLFTKVATDLGLCCALNTRDILKQSEYQELVKEQQEQEKKTLAETTGGKITAGVGMKKGVKVVLDLHSDQQSFSSVSGMSRGFQVFIGQQWEFPVLQQRSLPIHPGAEHRLDLSAISLTSEGIGGIKPLDRRCFFKHEGNLEFYKDYSYISCIFSCKVR